MQGYSYSKNRPETALCFLSCPSNGNKLCYFNICLLRIYFIEIDEFRTIICSTDKVPWRKPLFEQVAILRATEKCLENVLLEYIE